MKCAYVGLLFLGVALGLGAATAVVPRTARAACQTGTGPVRQTLALPDGRAVELHTRALVVGGQLYDRCTGLPDPYPTAIAVLGPDLFVGFRERGLTRFQNGRFEPVAGGVLTTVRALAARGDVLWVGTPKGLFRWTRRGGLARPERRLLRRHAIADLAVDGRGRLHVATSHAWWIHTGTRWVVRARTAVGCFRGDPVRPASPLACAGGADEGEPLHVTALATLEGTLFAGTFDDGIYFRARGGWVRERGAPRFVNALAAGAGALFVGTPEGVFRRDGHGRYRRIELGLDGSHANALLATPDGALWVATSEGALRWDGRTVRVYDARHGLPASMTFAVERTEDGAIWLATSGGVARLAGSDLQTYSLASGTLPHDWVTSLAADGTSVLAGTYDRGVARLFPDGTSEPVPALADLWVNPSGIARVRGRWLLTTLGDGLWTWDGRRTERVARLPSEDVTAVAPANGTLWVATRRGVARIPWDG